MKKQFDFAKAMKELEEINAWFQEEEIDLDQGLEKLKRGKELISACRERLKDVENQFVQIRDQEKTPEEMPVEEITVTTITEQDDEEEDDIPF